MPRPLLRLAALASALALSAGPARAQDAEPPAPADLVRGLRIAGLPDLALEYLDHATATAPAAAQTLLLLERGRLRVELAGQEPDAVKRDEYMSAAAADFKQFQAQAPRHPRGAEAAASLAQMLSLQAYAIYLPAAAAARAPNSSADAKAVAKSDLAKAREKYREAGVQFAKAADGLTASATAADGARKRELTRELLQTKLDAAINQFRYGLACDDASDQIKAIQAAYKGQSADTKTGRPAVDGFDALRGEDPTQPACQIARAWVGECHLKLDSKKEALDVFSAILADNRRLNTEATRAGFRMARFFDLRNKFDLANTAAENKAVADAAETWLNDYRGRTTAETYAVMYYRAKALFDQSRVLLVTRKEAAEKAKPPQVYVPSADANLVQGFRAAEVEFRKLLAVDSEFTQRATSFRNTALRVIVGDTVKPPAEYKTFDECHMASLVQYMKINEAKDAAERDAAVATTLGLLERARTLPVPAESAREGQTSQLLLISTYRMAGRPAEAAILADYGMRGSRAATGVAKFGGQALGAYLDSSRKVPGTDPAAKRVDLDRALTVAAYLDKTVPADAVAEEARLILAAQMNQDGKPLEAFETFARVTPKAARFTLARQLEGRTAYFLIRPLPADHADTKKRPDLKPEQKGAIYNRAVADLGAVPKPIDDAPAAEALAYLEVRLQLAQLHVAAGGDACVTADQMAQATRAAAGTFKALKPDERDGILLQADLVRIDAVYEQARVLTKAEKFKEAADKLAPLLADVANAGPAVKEGQPAEVARLAAKLDASRLSYAVVPALNARVRDGDIVKATELLDLLKKLGGDARRVMQAVFEVVQGSRPQIDAMRKGGRAEEANKLSAAVAQLVTKVADEKNLSPSDNLNLGRSFFQLGDYAKANEILARVPKPADPEFLKAEVPEPKREPTDSDEEFKKKSDAWRVSAIELERYRLASLDRIRATRLFPDLKGCEALIDETMGKEAENPKNKNEKIRTGLFAKRIEFRREAILLDEAKAAVAPAAAGNAPWVKAIAGWSTLNNEARGILVRPEPKEEQAAAALRQYKLTVAKPQYFDTFYEKCRCQLAAFRAVNKNNPKGLAAGLANVTRNLLAVEKANATDFDRKVHLKLAELLDANPDLKKDYTDAGGKLLLAKPPADE